MKITAARSRESGNPRGAVAIVASLFTVAFVIAMLPRDREPNPATVLAARPHGVLIALSAPAVADQPAFVEASPAVAPETREPLPPVAASPGPIVETASAAIDPIFTFSAPVAELPVLPARPLLAAGTPDAMMSPPAVAADGDHVLSTAFRQTGAAVRLAFRKTGEGVKTAFTSIPW